MTKRKRFTVLLDLRSESAILQVAKDNDYGDKGFSQALRRIIWDWIDYQDAGIPPPRLTPKSQPDL